MSRLVETTCTVRDQERVYCIVKDLSMYCIQLISFRLGIAAVYYVFFGLLGAIFFIGQGLIALTTSHLITYIQHYGLKRLQSDDGRYKRFSAALLELRLSDIQHGILSSPSSCRSSPESGSRLSVSAASR